MRWRSLSLLLLSVSGCAAGPSYVNPGLQYGPCIADSPSSTRPFGLRNDAPRPIRIGLAEVPRGHSWWCLLGDPAPRGLVRTWAATILAPSVNPGAPKVAVLSRDGRYALGHPIVFTRLDDAGAEGYVDWRREVRVATVSSQELDRARSQRVIRQQQWVIGEQQRTIFAQRQAIVRQATALAAAEDRRAELERTLLAARDENHALRTERDALSQRITTEEASFRGAVARLEAELRSTREGRDEDQRRLLQLQAALLQSSNPPLPPDVQQAIGRGDRGTVATWVIQSLRRSIVARPTLCSLVAKAAGYGVGVVLGQLSPYGKLGAFILGWVLGSTIDSIADDLVHTICSGASGTA